MFHVPAHKNLANPPAQQRITMLAAPRATAPRRAKRPASNVVSIHLRQRRQPALRGPITRQFVNLRGYAAECVTLSFTVFGASFLGIMAAATLF